MLTGSHWQAVWRMPSPGRRTHARTYGRTTRKHNAFGPVSCVGRGINMRRTKARALATNCILRPQPRQCPTRMDGSCEERRRKHARYYRSPGRPTRAICSRDFTVSVSRAKHWGPVNVTLFIPTECSRDSRRHFSYSEWGGRFGCCSPRKDDIWHRWRWNLTKIDQTSSFTRAVEGYREWHPNILRKFEGTYPLRDFTNFLKDLWAVLCSVKNQILGISLKNFRIIGHAFCDWQASY